MQSRLDPSGLVVSCARCGGDNRVPFARLHQRGRCGACKEPLPTPGHPVAVPSVAAFDALAKAASVPLLVDFWAPWCGPCRMLAPELEKAASALSGRALVVKVNTDDLPQLGGRFEIAAIPTLALLRGGAVTSRTSGVVRAEQLVAWVERAAGAAGSPRAQRV